MSCGSRYRWLRSDEAAEENIKRQKISYTRDFLLSICDLDTCRRLPRGFNASVLRELEVDKNSTSSGYSRGMRCRWETQSYGLTDRDCQRSLSDPVRPHGNPYHRSWQNPEHDGLLGSGTIPKVPLCAVGVQSENVPRNGHQQFRKNDDPFRPLQSSKVLLKSGRESRDSYNDETFGSVECTTQERAEEEERRKASFELMRKEHQKAIQEKQSQIGGGHKENVVTFGDESRNNEALLTTINELEDNVAPGALDNDPAHANFSIPSPLYRVSRPIFPAGFIAGSLEENPRANSLHCIAGEEHNDKEADSPISDTSKFPHWSLEGEKKLAWGRLSANEKSKPLVSEMSTGKNTEHNLQAPSLEREQLLYKLTTSTPTFSKDDTCEKMYSVDNPTVNSSQIVTYEDLEQPILLDVHGHRPVHQFPVPSHNHSDSEKQQLKPGNDNSMPLDHLSLSKKGGILIDLAKLNMRSSGNQLFNSGPHSTEKNTVNNLILKEIPGSEFMEDLHSVEASLSFKRDSFLQIPKDVSECHPVCGHRFSPYAVAELVVASNSRKDTRLAEESIKHLDCDNTRAEMGGNSQLGKMMDLSPVTGFDEKTDWSDEFCFPDEDSLIGVDDFKIPQGFQHSTFVSAGDPINGDATNSHASVNIAEKLRALNLPLGNGRHTAPHLENPPCHYGSYSVPSSESPYHDSRVWHLNSQFHHANLNAGEAQGQLLGSSQSDIIFKIRPMDPNSYFHNPPSQHHDFHSQYGPSPHTITRPTGFDSLVHESPLRHMSMDVNGLQNGTRHPPSIGGVSCYAEELISMQRFHQYPQRPGYRAITMFNQGTEGIGFSPHNQVAFEMELRARQMHPSAWACGGRGSYGKGVVVRHRYGNKPLWY